ncbi:Peroxisomal membrane protein PER10 [Cyphellophora attinorum]|uniref:Peroxisomal membrane protein PEX14 n=1 Tax=Cyphellophora attinorum TaxID=1664694 RepID=A0A0N1HRT4_9EURO|nr:Peroxisomal membrane protein PER10 [Phialophora attinorum]KPI41114.1 Peroxisomal membrane protein PER10 [Phialophora attinorum]
MAPREELVTSAVNFLRDASVASSPVEKRIEFLKSKNLTQEEIDVSLARAAEDPSQPQTTQNPYYPPPAQYSRGPPQGQYQRDWRDWFIMATVVGGASYGLWMLAERYVKPLIAPPTPPQLEQDKAAIDEQFNKTFALLDTLSTDTETLKKAEEERTQRLDSAIADIESIISELKTANTKREDDARRMESEIKNMKDSLPRSIDNVRDASDRQLKELSGELASLKQLMSNRIGGQGPGGMAGIPKTQPANISSITSSSGAGAGTPTAETAPGSSTNVTGVNAPGKAPSFAMPTAPSSSTNPTPQQTQQPQRPASSTSFSSSGKAAIPAWQMAAQNKQNANQNFNIAPTPGAPNPPQGPPQDGADAVAALTST